MICVSVCCGAAPRTPQLLNVAPARLWQTIPQTLSPLVVSHDAIGLSPETCLISPPHAGNRMQTSQRLSIPNADFRGVAISHRSRPVGLRSHALEALHGRSFFSLKRLSDLVPSGADLRVIAVRGRSGSLRRRNYYETTRAPVWLAINSIGRPSHRDTPVSIIRP